MAKRQLIFLIFWVLPLFALADHITGGQMFYKYNGKLNGLDYYDVTLKLYMRCNSGRQFPNPAYISVFDKSSLVRVSDIPVTLNNQETISLTESNPCITNPPQVCYIVGYYTFSISLQPSQTGYLLSAQVNYRIENISNLTTGYGQIGATYTTAIPGNKEVENADVNSSAQFTGGDLVVSCARNAFTYNFSATDPDGDKLRYYFCDAYVSGGGGRGAVGAPASAPPYVRVPYGNGFQGSSPLGNNVRIDPQTGMISGIAPGEGIYVVTVCVDEIRSGVVIATQRKDLQINIADCIIAAASLLPDYNLCGDTRSLSISNQSFSPLIKSYSWDFSNAAGNSIFSSSAANVSYSFPDTGIYHIKLVVNRGGPCSDSSTTLARVYPGFAPKFNSQGICINKSVSFTDASTSVYGTVNSWSWDFGDSSPNDYSYSNEQDPGHIYAFVGPKTVQLVVSDSKGCTDTVSKVLDILDKPPILLAFRDTLICLNDQLPLLASGQGIFSWSPLNNIVNANSPSPVVSPKQSAVYYVHLDEAGCVNDDSVRVNVVDHVSLQLRSDTTICAGDTTRLNILSNGLQYNWTPQDHVYSPANASPLAVTFITTAYQVKATIGGCSAQGSIRIATVPYPTVDAGEDKFICFDSPVQLHAVSDGIIYSWIPASTLNNSNTLNPIAKPQGSTAYILTVFGNKGCPKPSRDTVIISPLPKIIASAGADTSVVTGQALQFNASGGSAYVWTPDFDLSATDIGNPTGIYHEPSVGIQYKVYVYNQAGCLDSAFVKVKVYNTRPSVFVPTAFTPNNDGKNDKLRLIAAGMKEIEYFNVYDRWGKLVFTTRTIGDGWDGTIGGQLQATGVFIWVVKATDYNGAPYFQKGTTALIR